MNIKYHPRKMNSDMPPILALFVLLESKIDITFLLTANNQYIFSFVTDGEERNL